MGQALVHKKPVSPLKTSKICHQLWWDFCNNAVHASSCRKNATRGCPCIRGPLGHPARPLLPWIGDFHFFLQELLAPVRPQKWLKNAFFCHLESKKSVLRPQTPPQNHKMCPTITPNHYGGCKIRLRISPQHSGKLRPWTNFAVVVPIGGAHGHN